MARSWGDTGGSKLRVRMLYESFTTWSAEIIPRRGAFFSLEPPGAEANRFHTGVLAAYPSPLVHGQTISAGANGSATATSVAADSAASAGPILDSELPSAEGEQAPRIDEDGLQPLVLPQRPPPGPASAALAALPSRRRRSSSTDANGSDIDADSASNVEGRGRIFWAGEAWEHLDAAELASALMPPAAPPPSTSSSLTDALAATTSSLHERLSDLQKCLIARVQRQANAGGAGAMLDGDGGKELPLSRELAVDADEYRNTLLSLKLADQAYLRLVRRLNVNQRSGETKRVTVRHPECEQPVMFVLPQIQIVPGPPEVQQQLQANRASFVALHATLSELALRFAKVAELLSALGHSLHLDGMVAFDSKASGQPNRGTSVAGVPMPEEALRAGAIEFYFILLRIACGYELPPAIDRLTTFLSSSLATLGAAYLGGVTEMQRRLLASILQARAVSPPTLVPTHQLRQLALQPSTRRAQSRPPTQERPPTSGPVDPNAAVATAAGNAAEKKGRPGGSDGGQAGRVDSTGRLDVPLLDGATEAADSSAGPSPRDVGYLPPTATDGGSGSSGATADPERLPVRMPQGVVPGEQYTARLASGEKVVFRAPPNATPGMLIHVDVPPAEATAVADSLGGSSSGGGGKNGMAHGEVVGEANDAEESLSAAKVPTSLNISHHISPRPHCVALTASAAPT